MAELNVRERAAERRMAGWMWGWTLAAVALAAFVVVHGIMH